MSAKLTLRINPLLILQAKLYAGERKKSVSQMVGDYFSLLSKPVENTVASSLPLTSSLRGALKNGDLSQHDYQQYLEEKYL